MTASFVSSYINWKLVSHMADADREFYEYECPIQNSNRKYHLSVVVDPMGERHSYRVI